MFKASVYVLMMLHVILVPVRSFAVQADGGMSVELVDPNQMSEFEAKVWCALHIQSLKCQKLEEKWLKEQQQKFMAAKSREDLITNYE